MFSPLHLLLDVTADEMWDASLELEVWSSETSREACLGRGRYALSNILAMNGVTVNKSALPVPSRPATTPTPALLNKGSVAVVARPSTGDGGMVLAPSSSSSAPPSTHLEVPFPLRKDCSLDATIDLIATTNFVESGPGNNANAGKAQVHLMFLTTSSEGVQERKERKEKEKSTVVDGPNRCTALPFTYLCLSYFHVYFIRPPLHFLFHRSLYVFDPSFLDERKVSKSKFVDFQSFPLFFNSITPSSNREDDCYDAKGETNMNFKNWL